MSSPSSSEPPKSAAHATSEGDEVARIDEAVAAVRARMGSRAPSIGVVLGSGLGGWADQLADKISIPYAEIPYMPRSKVVGHAGNLVLGRVGSAEVACLQGRVHLYEGHDPDTAVRAVRVLARLGCTAVVLTNAAGGLDQAFTPGDLMLITDHLNLTGKNPLVGANDDRLGPRFPDMTRAYDPELASLARRAADETGTSLQKGVYAALLGPTYETPAEIHMLRVLGANAVGMSTVPEVIALRHMGVPVGAISCITNMAAGMTGEVLDHSEVETTARAARERFTKLLGRWIELVGAAQRRAP
jgi:purine-nucleoside phosphorylase